MKLHFSLETALLLWFNQVREKKIPLTGNILREKAKKFAHDLGIEGFSASDGWLGKFRKRNGISWRKICGEADNVIQETVDIYRQEVLDELLDSYAAEDIFNLDEFGLFYKALPDSTMSFKNDRCCDGKFAKNRLSVLAGSNLSGCEKLPLLVIGQSAKPRCFKNVTSLPTKYRNNSKSWMTSVLFEEELVEWDAKLRAAGRLVLCIVDNCSAHPKNLKSKLTNINLQFLPPNCTSVLQPMNMGIIKNLKHFYRSKLVNRVLMAIDDGVEAESITVLDAMQIISSSWSSVKEETIRNCFMKAGWIQVVVVVVCLLTIG